MKAFGLKIEMKLLMLSFLLLQALCDNNEDRLDAVEEKVQELNLLIQSVQSFGLETKELLLKESNARKEADRKIEEADKIIKETNENLSKINKTVSAVTGNRILREACEDFQLVGGLNSKKSKAMSYLDFGIKNQFYQEVNALALSLSF